MRRRQLLTLFMLLTVMATVLVACGGAPALQSSNSTSAPAVATAPAAPTATASPSTVPVPTAIPPTAALPTVAPQVIANNIDIALNKLTKQNLLSGAVLIGQHGTIVLSKGYGLADNDKKIPNTPQTKFRIASITKQFTAMAILLLEARGKLTVHDRICTYLASCPAAWHDITIHHLLTHTSGIPDFTELPDYSKVKKSPSTPEQTIALVRDKPLEFKPGEQWAYSNSGYVILGAIIEKVANTSYENFLRDQIFTPLQMTSTGYDHNTGDLATGYMNSLAKADAIDMSVPYAADGLYSTVEDLYRWDQALYTEQLIAKPFLARMFTPAIIIPGMGGIGYGYGWYIGIEDNHSVQAHPGEIEGFRSVIVRYPDDNVTIIVLTNREDANADEISHLLAPMVFATR